MPIIQAMLRTSALILLVCAPVLAEEDHVLTGAGPGFVFHTTDRGAEITLAGYSFNVVHLDGDKPLSDLDHWAIMRGIDGSSSKGKVQKIWKLYGQDLKSFEAIINSKDKRKASMKVFLAHVADELAEWRKAGNTQDMDKRIQEDRAAMQPILRFYNVMKDQF